MNSDQSQNVSLQTTEADRDKYLPLSRVVILLAASALPAHAQQQALPKESVRDEFFWLGEINKASTVIKLCGSPTVTTPDGRSIDLRTSCRARSSCLNTI